MPHSTLQSSIEAHFELLAQSRRANGLPVFALEHGLDAATLDLIASSLRRDIVFGASIVTYWLLWVIYAAELGYNYEGGEYWYSFEKQTPQWRLDPNRRSQLRACFSRFRDRFGGIQPTGPWAMQFSIIAWPITHAVLPRDLQIQMARTLFEHRHTFADALNLPAAQLGVLVAQLSRGASSRFRNFVEQKELTGRIVKALLLPGDESAGAALSASTLARVVEDLENSWEAKTWLKEARVAVDAVRIRVLARRAAEVFNGSDRATRDTWEASEARCAAPRVHLRPTDKGTWSAFVDVTPLIGWARTNSEVDAFLRGTRCKVRGCEDIWQARGWLLYGAQGKRLHQWPGTSTSWYSFEQWQESLVRQISEECRIPTLPALFRIDEDGRADLIKGNTVKPGSRYMRLHNDELDPNELLTKVELEFQGVLAHILDVPSKATPTSIAALQRLGLSSVRVALHVWPVGQSPLSFDDSTLEWASTVPLILGIETDETCDGFSIHLDRKSAQFAANGGRVSFIDLGFLAVGIHQLHIRTTYLVAGTSTHLQTQAGQKTLTIVVRTSSLVARRVDPVITVTTDPHEPTLDALVRGSASCIVHGPSGRHVELLLELLDGAANVFHTEALGSLVVPIDANAWKSFIASRQTNSSPSEAYLRANAARLVLHAGDLGSASVQLKNSVAPIRWQVREEGRRPQLTLVDDTDHLEPVVLDRATFIAPTVSEPGASRNDVVDGTTIDVEADGGLYIATTGEHRSCIVINVLVAGKMQFSDWKHQASPSLPQHLKDGREVAGLLRWIRDWSSARVFGRFAELRRTAVVKELHRQLYASMYDRAWMRAEAKFLEFDGNNESRECLELAVGGNPNFAIGLARSPESIVTTSVTDSARFLLGHARRYEIAIDAMACEVALRLALTPERFHDWSGEDTANILDATVNHKIILKVSRMLGLLLGERGRDIAANW